jgi:thiamine-phosphate pyrophosphorylase
LRLELKGRHDTALYVRADHEPILMFEIAAHGVCMSPSETGLDPFYLIVPDAASVARFAKAGVRTIQLRAKGLTSQQARREIVASLDAIMGTDCQLIVNDYWREAVSAGADYVHLGQEDLADADIPTLKAAGIRLGISTHDLAELGVALAAEPDSIALGPIYATTTKSTGRAPQGLDRIAEWRRMISPELPLVVIGGITLDTAPALIAAGAQSCAVVSDVLGSPSPDARAATWLAWSDRIQKS